MDLVDSRHILFHRKASSENSQDILILQVSLPFCCFSLFDRLMGPSFLSKIGWVECGCWCETLLVLVGKVFFGAICSCSDCVEILLLLHKTVSWDCFVHECLLLNTIWHHSGRWQDGGVISLTYRVYPGRLV